MVAAFINEIKLDGCQTITLDAENGKVVLSTVSTVNHPMIIVTMSAKDVLLGSLLHSVKRASENIAKADQ
jgi:predicted regulator of Ras-like GTPase activity (Roadblock/LC7/MglB family)